LGKETTIDTHGLKERIEPKRLVRFIMERTSVELMMKSISRTGSQFEFLAKNTAESRRLFYLLLPLHSICKAMEDTKQQFERVIAICRDLFSKKLHDYSPAWRILRPASLTDQIYIKANRIRSIETKGVSLVGEGVRGEFIAIVNYGIVGLIQLELGYAEAADISNDEALALYDNYAKKALDLMLVKNHDYGEAWRGMRISSYTDLILMKIYRTKQIESLAGNTLISEDVDANYLDMINYAVFGLIKLEFGE
jgi:hypothetical protein